MHGPYELFDLGDFVLEESYTLRECKLAYTTFGEPSEAKDNAILVTTVAPRNEATKLKAATHFGA